MKKLLALALRITALAPAVAAQTIASFTGKWEGTFTPQRPDGTEGNPNQVVFNLTQKGKVLTGTGGPPTQQWNVEKAPLTPARPPLKSSSPTDR